MSSGEAQVAALPLSSELSDWSSFSEGFANTDLADRVREQSGAGGGGHDRSGVAAVDLEGLLSALPSLTRSREPSVGSSHSTPPRANSTGSGVGAAASAEGPCSAKGPPCQLESHSANSGRRRPTLGADASVPDAKRPSYIPDIPEPTAVSGEGDAPPGTVVSKMDKRSWLEVLDARHRYAKNLRVYYQAWDLLGKPSGDFWRWLDRNESPYEAALCPRSELDHDTVRYCEPREVERFAVHIQPDGAFCHAAGSGHPRSGAPLQTGDSGFIFVLQRGTVFAAEKVTVSPRFHHSSFFGGGPVEVAGMLVTDEAGRLLRILPHSGHYRPRDEHLLYLLRFLRARNVDLATIEVDAQRTQRVAREAREGGRVKKKEAPHFVQGDFLLGFLRSKAENTQVFAELLATRKERTGASAGTCELQGGIDGFGNGFGGDFGGSLGGSLGGGRKICLGAAEDEDARDAMLRVVADEDEFGGSGSPESGSAWGLEGLDLARRRL